MTYEIVVVGGGAAGLTAALVAAIEGRRTLLIERSTHIGGTAARSSGSAWIPGNPDARERLGITHDSERALGYLERLTAGRGAERSLLERFLAAGPELLHYLAEHAGMRFRAYDVQPDYRQDLEGATVGGRAVAPPEFDGRLLGDAFARVRPPLPELTLFGGMMVTRGEASRLLRIGRSWDALALGSRLTARYVHDRTRFSRGTRLVLGNALVARLFHELRARRADVWFDTRVTAVRSDTVSTDRGTVRARCGVVLAGGGFPAGAEWRRRYLPEPTPRHTAAVNECTGATIALGLDAGGTLGPPGEDNAYWFPSSIATRRDGSTAVYPHIVLDRAKPGLVAVGADGRRFVDEAVSYHDFVRAMYRVHAVPALLVCDRRFVFKYGLGLVKPLTPRLRRGYLHVADSLGELAEQAGVDPTGLQETVSAHNEFARTGVDEQFRKGESAYDRAYGDASHAPNPCLGRIEKPPFCAVEVWPTPLGTSLGLRADENARVLDPAGTPVPGLYVCGNDMQSITGGEYPGSGAQIGIGMTFAYLAAKHAAHRAMVA